MVELLREAYLSGKTPGSWSKQDYAKAQETLDGYLRFWIDVDAKWLFLIPDRIRPFTIAFIRILARLSGLQPGKTGGSLLSAKLTVGGKAMDLTRAV